MAADTPARAGTMQDWLDSWDAQQEREAPDRRQRFEVLADLVEVATAGRPQPLVLDLACGPGSVTRHLLGRHRLGGGGGRPALQVVALDVDPVLLQIASGTIGAEPDVRLVEADLRDPHWASEVLPAPDSRFDAVVTATALHWLSSSDLERVYRDLAGLIRPGGLFADGDHVPLHSAPLLSEMTGQIRDTESAGRLGRHSALDWESWWQAVGADPGLAESLARRRTMFGTTHPDTFAPPESWHIEYLTAAGFSEAAVVGRRYGNAVVAAVR